MSLGAGLSFRLTAPRTFARKVLANGPPHRPRISLTPHVPVSVGELSSFKPDSSKT
jgi:hypothetical protein